MLAIKAKGSRNKLQNMRNLENIYHIVRGQGAISSLWLIWKYITAGRRNITKHRMLINYFS